MRHLTPKGKRIIKAAAPEGCSSFLPNRVAFLQKNFHIDFALS